MYVFDATSIELMINLFPPRFKSLWQEIDGAIVEGKIVSVYEAFKALNSVASIEWKTTHKRMFKKLTMRQALLLKEMFTKNRGQFQNLISPAQLYKGLPTPIPFVLASAKINDATVVSEEKIKSVCQHFALPYTNFEGVMRKEGWEF